MDVMPDMRASALGLTLLLTGCAVPPTVVDFADYHAAPQRYAETDAIVRTDLTTLLANKDALKGRRVELVGQVDYRGHVGFSYWHFYLTDDQGHTLRCYEREYHVDSWAWARTLARKADAEHGTIVVSGRYRPPSGLELDWFDYLGHHVDTDYRPPVFVLPWR
nr:F98 [uncultured bacterium]